jgi:hypothetical protein
MKTKKTLLYMAAVLCMSISCKKELVPEDPLAGFRCNDGTCCGQGSITYQYVQKIENMPADYLGDTLGGRFLYNQPLGGEEYPNTIICELSRTKIKSLGLKKTYDRNTWPLKYRVWGIVYADISTPRLVAGPFYYILIDKVEFQN